MKAINILLATGAFVFLASPTRAGTCRAAWTEADGTVQTAAITLDLASAQRLDPATLPHGASAIMCLRSSIVPEPDDVRVLSELRIPFGIAVQEGPRTLWIYVEAGQVRYRVEHGDLSTAERAAANRWQEAAERRFILDWAQHQAAPAHH